MDSLERGAPVTTGSGEEIFVARQPIFDVQQKLFGYELLYRSSLHDSFDWVDGTSATLSVLRDAFLVLGTRLVGPNKAFINFNLDLLQKKVPLMLRPEATVIEILESVTAEESVVEICRELKGAGYTIALDDFAPRTGVAEALVDLADIIKVDFRAMGSAERAHVVKSLKGKKAEFLAEKVETPAEFTEAREMGYRYFQGYFFGKPHVLSAKNIPGNKVNHLRMLHEILRPDMDFLDLEGIIKQDTYLTYTLLNYINSAYFGLRGSVGSVMQALELLGEREIKRWASLVVLTFIGADKPSEVSITSLIRAKFCESLAMKTVFAGKAPELFMTGMFSMLDVLVGRPMDEVLDAINVSKEIRVALTTGDNLHGDLLKLVYAYERAAWQDVDSWAGRLDLDVAKIPPDYGQSVQWAETVFGLGMGGEARRN
jgi:c-di-GMP-related signal transduction protein